VKTGHFFWDDFIKEIKKFLERVQKIRKNKGLGGWEGIKNFK